MRTHVLIGVTAAAMIGLVGCGANSSDSNTPTASATGTAIRHAVIDRLNALQPPAVMGVERTSCG